MMNFNHINIKAPFPMLQEEKRFFLDVLRLHEGFRPQFPNRGFWIYSGDKPMIHLTEGDPIKDDPDQGCVDHLAFQSSELETFISHLGRLKTEYKVVYIDEIKTTQVFLKSPLGLKIEILFIDDKI